MYHSSSLQKIIQSCTVIGFGLMMSACTTIIQQQSLTDSSNIPSTLNDTLDKNTQLDNAIANQLNHLQNEIVVSNLLYVTHQKATIDGERFVLLNFHTTNNQVYRTRMLESKLNNQILQQLQQLKGATLINYLPIQGYPDQYFFKNFKNLKY